MIKETDCVFGLRAVIEAIKAGKQIARLLIKQGLQGALFYELMSEVKKFLGFVYLSFYDMCCYEQIVRLNLLPVKC